MVDGFFIGGTRWMLALSDDAEKPTGWRNSGRSGTHCRIPNGDRTGNGATIDGVGDRTAEFAVLAEYGVTVKQLIAGSAQELVSASAGPFCVTVRDRDKRG